MSRRFSSTLTSVSTRVSSARPTESARRSRLSASHGVKWVASPGRTSRALSHCIDEIVGHDICVLLAARLWRVAFVRLSGWVQ